MHRKFNLHKIVQERSKKKTQICQLYKCLQYVHTYGSPIGTYSKPKHHTLKVNPNIAPTVALEGHRE